jgi:hypothetical protein
MTTVEPVAMVRESKNTAGDENITIRGKFKSVDLFNKTIHIILYPDDGLRIAAKLQEIDEGTDVVLDLKTHEGF